MSQTSRQRLCITHGLQLLRGKDLEAAVGSHACKPKSTREYRPWNLRVLLDLGQRILEKMHILSRVDGVLGVV